MDNPERRAHAQEAIKEADKYFMRGGSEFTKALPLYEKAHAIDPDDAELNLKLGLCHLNSRYHYQSLPYFQKVLALDPSTPRIHFLLGLCPAIERPVGCGHRGVQGAQESN